MKSQLPLGLWKIFLFEPEQATQTTSTAASDDKEENEKKFILTGCNENNLKQNLFS